jgi:hypothetical protein
MIKGKKEVREEKGLNEVKRIRREIKKKRSH